MFTVKLKYLLFGFIFIFSLGCIKATSGTSSNTGSSNNYYLAYTGYDHNGALSMSNKTTALKVFFQDTDDGIFQMNYDVTPSSEKDYNASLEEFQTQIENISSKLDSNSTFIISIDAHGGKKGSIQTSTSLYSEDLTPQHIVDSLKKGLKQNSTLKGSSFKRFMLLMESCYSGSFVKIFKDIKEVKNKSLFREAIYFASSDAALATTAYLAGEDVFPFFLLRVFQIQRCNSSNDYKTDYKLAYDNLKEYLSQTLTHSLGTRLKFLDPDNKDLITIHDTPVFKDYQDMIKLIKKERASKSDDPETITDYSSFLSYSDLSLKQSEIFPRVCN